jgi:murein DD-endopeptidase MepM/ murein hydrolase activator NlpD
MSWRRPMRHVLIVLFREDKLDSHTWRVPLWALRAGAGVLGALVLLALLGVAFYGPVASTAARVPGLTREVDRLRAENTRVLELAAALDSVEAGYARLRAMVGADIAPDPAALTQRVFVAAPIVARLPGEQRYTVAPGIPAYWPLDDQGYVTRGTVDTTGVDEAHPGLDIAVREGTIVRATAGGTIVEAGDARDYGLYVLMRHAEGYESMYGHLSRILVQAGQVLPAGSALGLSGNTGRSTAPHLHFEIRRAGRPVDPATLVKEAP